MFKLPNRHRHFEYVPRYYDARKEALRKKIEQAERIEDRALSDKKKRDIAFRAKTEDKWGNSHYKAASMRQNIRLIVILGMLVVGVYFIFTAIDTDIEPLIEKFYE